MEAPAAGLVDAQVDIPFEVEEVGEGIRLGDAEVVAGDHPQPAAAAKQVAEVFDDAAHAALQPEGDGEVGVPGPAEARPQVGQEGVLAEDDRLLVRQLGQCRRKVCLGEVVGLRRDDVTDAATRVGYVPGVARDDVHVEVEDRLAGGRADVPADVEAVGLVTLEDFLAGDVEGAEQLLLILRCRLPPGGDVTAGDEESVPGGYGEGVPQAQDQLAGVEDPLRRRWAEGAEGFRHGAPQGMQGGARSGLLQQHP